MITISQFCFVQQHKNAMHENGAARIKFFVLINPMHYLSTNWATKGVIVMMIFEILVRYFRTFIQVSSVSFSWFVFNGPVY